MNLTLPAGVHWGESKQVQLYTTYTICYALAVIAVIIRLICRILLAKVKLWWDDWAIIVAAVVAAEKYALLLDWVRYGLGTHIYQWGAPGIEYCLRTLFLVEFFYALIILLVKYSMLLSFCRIFGRKDLLWPISIMAVVVGLWTMAHVAIPIVQCLPIAEFWGGTTSNATCLVSVEGFFIGNAVPNIVTDFTLLFLPIPHIWRLQRNTAQKFAVGGAFFLGGVVCIISLVRLASLLMAYESSQADVTWALVSPSIWTAVEANLAIVAACALSFKPMLPLCSESYRRLDSEEPVGDKLGSHGSSDAWEKVNDEGRGDLYGYNGSEDHSAAVVSTQTDARARLIPDIV